MTVNLMLRGIPEFNPHTTYKNGDLYYIPELDGVFMVDKCEGKRVLVAGEILYDGLEVTYNVRLRGTGKGAIIAKCMPDGWNKIKKVIFNDPATIVFWQDGTKTVVKCTDGEPYDLEKGLMAAITKKAFGNLGNYYNQIKKWLPENEKEEANNGT
jgi:hypothetical protein